MLVNVQSFQANTTNDNYVDGTVEVTIGKQTKRVSCCYDVRLNWYVARGSMVGRYRTGGKAWPASIHVRFGADGKPWETVSFGRDDRSGKFRKENCIYFA